MKANILITKYKTVSGDGSIYIGSSTEYNVKINGKTIDTDGKDLKSIKKELKQKYDVNEFEIEKTSKTYNISRLTRY